jgi:hypothetical protein
VTDDPECLTARDLEGDIAKRPELVGLPPEGLEPLEQQWMFLVSLRTAAANTICL